MQKVLKILLNLFDFVLEFLEVGLYIFLFLLIFVIIYFTASVENYEFLNSISIKIIFEDMIRIMNV